jgi:hypothetical protein
MNTQNTATARLVYENGLKIVKEAGLDPNVVKLTQSDLVLEQQLFINITQYQFPVLNNQNGQGGNTIFNTEVRLTQQDSFISSAWGFFLAAPGSAVDATFIVQTYPNPLVFAGGASAAAETLYNSVAQIKVNNDVVYPVWHLSRHRMVPQTQQTATIVGVENGNAYSQIDLSSDGFFPMEPNFVIIGSKNTVITAILPAALAAVTAFQRARFHFRGLLAQNSTIIT